MPQPFADFDFSHLTASEKLDLIAQLWDSIPEPSSDSDVPEWHRQELQRRVALSDATPEKAIPWEQVRARLRSKP